MRVLSFLSFDQGPEVGAVAKQPDVGILAETPFASGRSTRNRIAPAIATSASARSTASTLAFARLNERSWRHLVRPHLAYCSELTFHCLFDTSQLGGDFDVGIPLHLPESDRSKGLVAEPGEQPLTFLRHLG